MKILEYIKKKGIYDAIDNIYADMTKSKKIKSYIIKDVVFVQNRKELGSHIDEKERTKEHKLCQTGIIPKIEALISRASSHIG